MKKMIIAAAAAAVLLNPTITKADITDEILRIKEMWAVTAMHKVWDFEEGQTHEDATLEDLEEAKRLMEMLPDGNGHKENLQIMADAAEAELGKEYFGTCTITAYCNCYECCHQYAGGNTASGVAPTPGRTVAHNYLPFGTVLSIDGHEYIVEDRGDANMAGGMWIDIYFGSHSEACAFGMKQAEVYIVE